MWNLDRLNGKGTEDELKAVRALLETEAGKLEIPCWEKSPAEELAVSRCLPWAQTTAGPAALWPVGPSRQVLAPRKQDVSLPAGSVF